MKKLSFFLLMFIGVGLLKANNVELMFSNKKVSEQTISKKTFLKSINGQFKTFVLIVGHDTFGNVSSVSLEFDDSNMSTIQKNNLLTKTKQNIQKISESFLISRESFLAPGPSCIELCTKKYDCYGKQTPAGVYLCLGDCLVEC